MRFTCVVACLLAAPEAAAFYVTVPRALPRGSFAPAAAVSSSISGASRAALYKNLGPSLSALDSTTSRMSASVVPAAGQGGESLRPSTVLSASAVVSDGSGTSGAVAGGSSAGGGDLVVAGGKNKVFRAYEKGALYFTNLFPVWLTIFSGVALKDPTMFAWFTTE